MDGMGQRDSKRMTKEQLTLAFDLDLDRIESEKSDKSDNPMFGVRVKIGDEPIRELQAALHISSLRYIFTLNI